MFELAKERFFRPMLEASVAHALMLEKQRIVSRDACVSIVGACRSLLMEGSGDLRYEADIEDLFFKLEAHARQMAGAEATESMHVAMSRNDLDAAIYRMAVRQEILDVLELSNELRGRLLQLAEGEAETLMAAHTHGQLAQPTTLGHYLLAVEAHLARGFERGHSLWRRVNLSPLGAAALAGTGFSVDREFVARCLGFSGLVHNTYDAVAASDHLLETVTFIMLDLATLSRFATDLITLALNEVSGITLDDSLVQISSIMPHKRNPVALEHLRAMLSRTLGQCQPVFWAVHNCPFGDVQDVGDELQVALARLVEDAKQVLRLACEIVSGIHVNRDVLAERARRGFCTSTELADTLVREHGFTFRSAHAVVSEFVKTLKESGLDLLGGSARLLDEVSMTIVARVTGVSEEEYRRVIDPVHFVRVRSVVGGPSPGEVRRQLAESRKRLLRDNETLTGLQQSLRHASNHLWESVEHLLGEGGGRTSAPAPGP